MRRAAFVDTLPARFFLLGACLVLLILCILVLVLVLGGYGGYYRPRRAIGTSVVVPDVVGLLLLALLVYLVLRVLGVLV